MKQIDYYYTPSSPWTYLGSERLRLLAARCGAEINHRPVDLAPILASSGGLPLAKRSPQRQAYRLFELKRFSERTGVKLDLHPPHFGKPVDLAARVLIAAQRVGFDPALLSEAFMRGLWAEQRDISDPATLVALADANGLPGGELLAAASLPLVAAIFAAYTDEAMTRGVFGAPTYFYRDEPFWGQDRLDFLEEALLRD
jgi:carboxymethylenebutenolidase